MGTANGSGEIITYISWKTGLVVRATEETSNSWISMIAKADGSNRVPYNIEAKTTPKSSGHGKRRRTTLT